MIKIKISQGYADINIQSETWTEALPIIQTMAEQTDVKVTVWEEEE